LGHSVTLKSDGTVWTWGYNYSGILGDGTTINRSTPVQVLGLSEIVAIAAGNGCSVALKSDGTVWTWGVNDYGQLGDGTTVSKNSPVWVLPPAQNESKSHGKTERKIRKHTKENRCKISNNVVK
jgi:alpha-tubulin suppressor-like RCC1 family protein